MSKKSSLFHLPNHPLTKHDACFLLYLNGRATRDWTLLGTVYLNPEKELEETKIEEKLEATAS